MADELIPMLGDKTPLMAAKHLVLTHWPKIGDWFGTYHTQGMKPGSDTANLSVLGYDPAKYYTGTSRWRH